MKHFAGLISSLDRTNKTKEKIQALVQFFQEAPDQDKLWAIALFTGKKPPKSVNSRLLRDWAMQSAGLPGWLFEESYQVVGDLAETISLLLPEPVSQEEKGLSEWMDWLDKLKKLEEEEKKTALQHAWQSLGKEEMFVFNKLLTGGWRIGVSQNLILKALAKVFKTEPPQIAHRIMGDWTPQSTTYKSLLLESNPGDDLSKPYPFYLAYPLEASVSKLGHVYEWQAEWKWDGIRIQLIVRQKKLFLWSRGEELISDKFPELQVLAEVLPDGTVIDGELLPFKNGKILDFGLLQTRIGRKNQSRKIMESCPVMIMAYDLPEIAGKDIRNNSLSSRRGRLSEIIKDCGCLHILAFSEEIPFSSWQELSVWRGRSREYHAEGLMIKRKESAYQTGRKKGDWWKWKVDALSIDGVLIYAQKGHGRRADLYTDYTFAVWYENQLVPFAKAYSGLTDAEIREVDRFIKKNTKEKFGPVRTVKPELVFEIAFEGIRKSTRHKSGIALRFPRIQRWRTDKKASEANTLKDLQKLLDVYAL
ncbi:MAG: ATP-dependent DNA ligase [Cyclobacteriaceae bacterium]|nr:ATP-dependent DNA ligase [Cyclobacteriaceae bacterium]